MQLRLNPVPLRPHMGCDDQSHTICRGRSYQLRKSCLYMEKTGVVMKTILIDAVGIHRVGGGRTSILNLLESLFGIDHDNQYLVLVSKREPTLEPFPNVKQITMPVSNRFAVRAYMQMTVPAWVKRYRVDLVHFMKNLGLFGVPSPYIVTIHDLTTLRLPRQSSYIDVLYWKIIEPLTVRKARRVVAVSYDTAKDIERFYGISQKEIEVVYWAPRANFKPVKDPERLDALRQRYSLPKRYILFVGILAKKKNLPTLLRALAGLHSRRPDAPDLVVVGRRYPPSNDTLSVRLVHQLGLENHVHFVGSVPDSDLPLFYSASDLFVLPSLHEGFGIPCLEAMACGVPVIVARGGALPEIVGDAGWVIDDPMDVTGLSIAMENVLYDHAIREEMVRRGFDRAASFSWEKSAKRMLEIYQTILEG